MKTIYGWLVMVVGKVSWCPPAWMRVLLRQWPRTLLGLVVLSLAGWGAVEGWSWYQNRPQPHRVAVTVQAPGVTPLAEKLVPQPLILRFAESVVPLEQAGKPAPKVTMEPLQAGSWRWDGDRTLRFDPTEDWPADTSYRITIPPLAVAGHVVLERPVVDWKTPAFSAEIGKVEFYQSPKDPAVKQVVATVNFTHPVESASLPRKAEFTLLGRDGRVPFEVTYDPHRRVAYLRTEALTLPEREDFMKVVVDRGVRTTLGGARTELAVEGKTRVPDVYSFFQIEGSRTGIVLDAQGEPEQFLFVTTTALVRSEDVAKELKIVRLPQRRAADGRRKWRGPKEINATILAAGQPVVTELVPSKDELSTEHTLKFRWDAHDQLYVGIGRNVKVPGGYRLRADYANVLEVPQPKPSLRIEGEGGVLALSGERKLSLKSRSLPGVRYEIARVESSQIHHLVSQTRGSFQNPEFWYGAFSADNISRLATEDQVLAMTDPFSANFSTFDFGPHLQVPSDGGSGRGLFFLTARGWDPVRKQQIYGANDERFLLVTDLGLIVKDNADGGREVYVASIQSGGPVAGVDVVLLGKNGLPLASGKTGDDGHVVLPAMGDKARDREPVAIVATLGDDVAFLPYDRADRRLNFSRFDTGGIEGVSGADLEAFLFTERGIYRPGDKVHAAYLLKQRDWQGSLTGLPVEWEVVDPRGRVSKVDRVAVPNGGLGEYEFSSGVAGPSGVYGMNLYLVRNGRRSTLLGRTDFWVKEFLPDRMKIASVLTGEKSPGWIRPEAIRVDLNLQNLYGSPASDRRVSGRVVLSPTGFRFPSLPGYRFFDPTLEKRDSLRPQEIKLDDQRTDETGAASFVVPVEKWADATYELTFFGEGFEASEGRSVNTQNRVRVSPLQYVVGYRPDGDLGYLPVGSSRTVHFRAVDAGLKAIDRTGLRFRLVEKTYVSVLTKQRSGSYTYESVERKNEVQNETLDLPGGGLAYALPTNRSGNFVLEVLDADARRLSVVPFAVVGAGDSNRSLEKDAELEVKLPRREYRAGEVVELAIAAPYTGSGLITLERDRVYAGVWFESSSTSSVQSLRIPDDFEGTGYLNVTFVRALDSREIFSSPLSYAVEPITVGREARRLAVTLDVPERAKPGEPLRIGYQTDRPSRIAVYAVDQGILQVSDYTLPDPLAYFFRQAALGVGTSQMLDLILPEYSILRSLSASGGGGDDLLKKGLNPFQRVTEKPVVFWSGIIDAGPDTREVVYDVPDYFNGTLKVMAVALAPDAAGQAEQASLVRSRWVITPGMPTAVAPGDVFEVGVTVNNGGETAAVALTATPSEALEVVAGPDGPLEIEAGREKTVTFTVRATDRLGSGQLEWVAESDGESSRRRATVSVRPAVPFRTEVQTSRFTNGSLAWPVNRAMYPEYRLLQASVSALPLGLAHGLDQYLATYPHGCSEQITSKAFCRLMLSDEVDFGLSREEVNQQMEHTFGVLRQRQNDQGGFGYWTSAGTDDFISVYVSHFLIEAKAAGFAPPQDVLAAALRHLRNLAARTSGNTLTAARIQAYAIYLLTREDVVTTNYVVNLRDTMDNQLGEIWKKDLAAVYLAGALALLQKDKDARRMLDGFRLGQEGRSDYFSTLGTDSQYVAVLARHFPDLLRALPVDDFLSVLRPIEEGRFSTLSAAYAVLALKGYSVVVGATDPALGMAEQRAGGETVALEASGRLMQKAAFSPEATELRFSGRANPVFCQMVQAGFEKKLPEKALRDGLEIIREFPETAQVGDPITVTLKVRSLTGRSISNAAIVDLLPGGFEVVAASLAPGQSPMTDWDFVEVREDRVVFFGTIGSGVQTISYQIKATNRGEYLVPPPFAESMYDRGINGQGVGQKIRVTAMP